MHFEIKNKYSVNQTKLQSTPPVMCNIQTEISWYSLSAMEKVSRETDQLTLRLQRNIRRKSLTSPGIGRRETFVFYWLYTCCTLSTFVHILLWPWINFGSMECMISVHACIMYECVCVCVCLSVPDDGVW